MAKKQTKKARPGNRNAAKANPRSEMLTVRLTAPELNSVQMAATICGVSITRMARNAILNEALLCLIHRDANGPVNIPWKAPGSPDR